MVERKIREQSHGQTAFV